MMKRGVALQGGGGKGSYQIGVWRAMQELGLHFNGVVGTSVGAINGAMMAQGDLTTAEALWRSISPDKVVAWEKYIDGFNALLTDKHKLPDIFTELITSGGLDTSPLEEMLRQHIDEKKVRRSPIEFGLCTVAIPRYQPKLIFIDDIPPGQLNDYIIASAGLPIFEKKKIEGTTHIDGGFFDDFPISMLLNRGYEEIIAVALYPKLLRKLPQQDGTEIILINPRESLGNILDFSNERVAWRIELGYADAMHTLAGLRGRFYCLRLPDPRVDAVAFFTQKAPASILLQHSLGLDAGDYRRIYFEKILPLAANALGLDAKAEYEDILALLLEHAAVKAGLAKLRIWSFEEMYRKLHRNNTWVTHPKLPDFSAIPLVGEALAVTANKEAFLDSLVSALLG